MKDYTKEIENHAQHISHAYTQSEICRRTSELINIIRKDVEAEEARLERDLKKTFDRCNEYFAEIERLKAESELYKSKYEGCERQSAIRGQMVESLVSGKSDKERLWEAMLSIANGYASKTHSPYWSSSVVAESANSLLNAFKEATKDMRT